MRWKTETCDFFLNLEEPSFVRMRVTSHMQQNETKEIGMDEALTGVEAIPQQTLRQRFRAWREVRNERRWKELDAERVPVYLARDREAELRDSLKAALLDWGESSPLQAEENRRELALCERRIEKYNRRLASYTTKLNELSRGFDGRRHPKPAILSQPTA